VRVDSNLRVPATVRLDSSAVVYQIRPPLGGTNPTVVHVVQDSTKGSITGVVRDSLSGTLLSHVSVQVFGTAFGATTDTAGFFAIPNLPPGNYTVVARRIGYTNMNAADIRVAAGVATTVDLKGSPAPLILSSVITRGGANPASVSYSVQLAGSSRVPTALCPIVEFLAAYEAGRVQAYADATRCAR
jgi:hypothetical protein